MWSSCVCLSLSLSPSLFSPPSPSLSLPPPLSLPLSIPPSLTNCFDLVLSLSLSGSLLMVDIVAMSVAGTDTTNPVTSSTLGENSI